MPFKPDPVQPEFDSLISALAQSKLKKQDEATYQTVYLIIKRISQLQGLLNDDIANLSNIFKSATFLTKDIEITKLPKSSQVLPGAGITISVKPDNKFVINSAIPIPDFCCGEEFDALPSSGGGSGAGSAGPPGPTGPAGATGSMGPPGLDSYQEEILYPIVLPGPTGSAGPTGPSGATGPAGLTIPSFDGEDGESVYIPGPAGANGAAGATGAQGIQGVPGPPGMDAEEPEPVYVIPGPQGAAGAGGGGSATTVEVDLGSTAVWRGKFTITDANITSSKKVLAWQAPGPYTGKGTLADEAELAPVQVIAVEPAAGSAVVKWQTPPMIVAMPLGLTGGDNGRIDNTTYSPIIGNGMGLASKYSPFDPSFTRRMNLVRGNVKFSYMVLT